MKKTQVIMACAIGSTLLFTGCKANTNQNTTSDVANISSSASQAQGLSYEISSNLYENENKNIKVTYPQIKGLNNDIENNWNEFIKNRISTLFSDKTGIGYEVNKTGIGYEVNYEIKTQSSELISILFIGHISGDGDADPDTEVVTLNIDLKNGNNIMLKDTGRVSACAEKLLKGDYSLKDDSLRESVKEYISGYDEKDLEEELSKFDVDLSDPNRDLSSLNSLPSGYSYYENGKLVLITNNVELIMD